MSYLESDTKQEPSKQSPESASADELSPPGLRLEPEVFVVESDLPMRPVEFRREDLVPFVTRGIKSELTSDSVPESKVTHSIGRSHIMEAANPISMPTVIWPDKHEVLGVEVSATGYEELMRLMVAAARRRQPALATFAAVHLIVTAALDLRYRYRINAFDVVAPDGQPVRWALNALHRTGLPERVCGPEIMLRLCRRAAEEGIGIYLYGSTLDTLDLLKANLEGRFPAIRIMGAESPPFRPLTPQENLAAVHRINSSGAGFVFIGLGCPRQDVFAYQNRNTINAVQLCVGAAFDFHAGKKAMAPLWVQKSGMEWIYRLAQEPRRLWKRYLITNTTFIVLMTRRILVGR